MTGYPPEPWYLAGDLTAALWLVPARALPAPDPAVSGLPGWSLVTVAGRAVVGTAFVRYRSPGVLTYDELLVAALVRRGRRVAVTVLQIWVDSPPSLTGGRELWAIPKELAEFTGAVLVRATGSPLADIALGAGAVLPGRWRVRFAVAQARDGRALVRPVAAIGSVAPARTRWRLSGPLGYLTGRRPVAGLAVRDFRMAFGGRPRPVRAALREAAITAQGWKRAAAGS